jgi:secondary thiamine-phosphate synthase enzyme
LTGGKETEVAVNSYRFSVSTKGETDIIDITDQVAEWLNTSGLRVGTATVFVSGSTGGVTTVEYESGLVEDLQRLFEQVAPKGAHYAHDARWGDGNGYAHVRASLLGPSLAVPFADGQLLLGTWQQIVVIDFDNRPRRREVVVQLVGE